MEWRTLSLLGGAGGPAYRRCGTFFPLRPQGGATGLQVLYDPAEAGRPLFLSAPGERMPESPLLHIFSQFEDRPVHPKVGTEHATVLGVPGAERESKGP